MANLTKRKHNPALVNYVFKKHIYPYYPITSAETRTFKKYVLARLYADDPNGHITYTGHVLRIYVYLSVQEYLNDKIVGWCLFVRPLYTKSRAITIYIKGSSYLSRRIKKEIVH